MRPFVLALSMACGHATNAPCSCDDLASIKKELANLQSRLAHLESGSGRAEQAAEAMIAVSGRAETRRALSHGGTSHFVAVDAKQVHEFPASGSCQPGTKTQLLSKARDGGTLDWTRSLTDSSSDLSLVSVTDHTTSPWTTSVLQSMPAPLKVVHDASCSSDPTLDLPLSTTVGTLAVSGSLTVGSTNIDVGTKLAGTWTDMTLESNIAVHAGMTPQYMIRDGFVYFRGAVTKSDGSNFAWNDGITYLPAEAQPTSQYTGILFPSGQDYAPGVRAQVDGQASGSWAGYVSVRDTLGSWPSAIYLTNYYAL